MGMVCLFAFQHAIGEILFRKMKDIYICESNPLHLRGLIQMLEVIGGPYRVRGNSGSIQEAVAFLAKNRVDILFLNAELEDGSAFDLLNLLEYRKFKVVLTHTTGEFALSAIRFSAIDYLVKPFGRKDLERTLDRISNIDAGMDMQLNGPARMVSRITIHGRQSIEFLDVNSILFCKADINYTEIHLFNDRKIVSSKTLKQYDLILQDHFFFRSHQSYLVNMKHVRNISRDKQPVMTLANGETVPLTRSKRPILIRQYGRIF